MDWREIAVVGEGKSMNSLSGTAESVTGDRDVYHIHTVRPFLHAYICSLANSQIKRQNLRVKNLENVVIRCNFPSRLISMLCRFIE